MVSITLKLKRLRPPELMLREFNGYVREGLDLAGQLWIRQFLPLHFGPGAFRRYRYASRTTKYLFRKAAKLGRRGPGARAGLMPGEDDQALVLTGQMREAALGGARPQATVTSNRQRLVVKVPTGHLLNPVHTGEVTKLLQEEARAMRGTVIAHVKDRVASRRQPEEVVVRPAA